MSHQHSLLHPTMPPSYDYASLVQQIHESTDLEESLDLFDTLSQHCPLTPTLWVLYARTAKQFLESKHQEQAALQMYQETIDYGLRQFPGSLLLRKLSGKPATMWAHGNDVDYESDWMMELFDKSLKDTDATDYLWLQRASRSLLMNESLVQQYQEWCDANEVPCTLKLEPAQRQAAATWSFSTVHTQAIHAALSNEQLLLACPLESLHAMQRFGMGLGSAMLAQTFCEYARAALQQQQKGVDWNQVAVCIYERGLAECPTVESIWLAYQQCPGLSQDDLEGICQRSVRNCPYSVTLVRKQLEIHGRRVVLDPEDLSQLAQAAWDRQFFVRPQDWWQVFGKVLHVAQQHLLRKICSTVWDSSIKPKQQVKKQEVDEDEMQDLLEDLADLYEDVERRLKAAHKGWKAGLALLYTERAFVERHLCSPLQDVLGDNENETAIDKEELGPWERAVKASNPPHPSICLQLIQRFMNQSQQFEEPIQIVLHLARVRYHFENLWQSTGRPKGVDEAELSRSLEQFAGLWTDFEGRFGSPTSLSRAQRAIRKKKNKLQVSETPSLFGLPPEAAQVDDQVESETEADAPNQVDSSQGETPKTSESCDTSVPEKQPALDSETKKKKTQKYHPFTIKVSNLSSQTDDMDLVDSFQRVGKLVHARVIRDRPTRISKGWALVQFEEKESANQALELEMGLHDSVWTIERHHVPAVDVVPSGMRRVGTKKDKGEEEARMPMKEDEKSAHDKPKITPKKRSALQFQPQGVRRKRRLG